VPLVRRTVTLVNPQGLHARPISKLLETAKRHESSLRIVSGGRQVNGRSMLDMLTLAAPAGAVLELEAEGPDAEALVSALERLVADRFGE
jgi:phosphocarrier protein HPr